MEDKLTRKEFLTATAAALGVATLVPVSSALAEPSEDAGDNGTQAPLEQLAMSVEHGSESLENSIWAESAPMPIDVVKSNNGLHMMNEPGYFVFTGWDPVNDHPTSSGFGLTPGSSGSRFVVMVPEIEFIGKVNITDGAIFGQLKDWVVEESVNKDPNNGWVWKKYASGIAEAWYNHFTSFATLIDWNGWSRSWFFNDIQFPFPFVSLPTLTRTYKPVSDGAACLVFEYGAASLTSTGSMFFGQNWAPSETTIHAYLMHHVSGRWK
ncbi:MAG: hypothetical protein LBG81_03755 [Coriobacteriaceae bacterium]|jgi:hypothetical protein|nr:hypothetical protein [Coriobacteriaceae bacterium]